MGTDIVSCWQTKYLRFDGHPGFCCEFGLPGIKGVEREKKARIGIDYHRLSSRSRSTAFGMTLSPKMAFVRAAKSGILNAGGVCARGGQMRATGRVRFKTVTSSPWPTHSSTILKSCRTCLIVAVFMCHSM